MTAYDLGPAEYPQFDALMYLTGVSNEQTRTADRRGLGVLATPASGTHCQVDHYQYYGADNGLYKENHPVDGFTFDPEAWLRWVDALPRAGCLFVTLPDVLHWHLDPAKVTRTGKPVYYCVGDVDATLTRSAVYADQVREMGFPLALVAQDGLTALDQVPFPVDCLFIGGSDDYKLGADVAALVAECRARGMWTHMGRVNSWKRLAIAQGFGCDSADGTYLKFGCKADREENTDRLIGWVDRLAAEYEAAA